MIKSFYVGQCSLAGEGYFIFKAYKNGVKDKMSF